MIKVAAIVFGIVIGLYIGIALRLIDVTEKQEKFNENQLEIDEKLIEGMELLANKCIK